MNKPSILELAVTNDVSLLHIGPNWWGYFPFFGHRQWLGGTPKRVHENLTNILNRYEQQCKRYQELIADAALGNALEQAIIAELSGTLKPMDWIEALCYYGEPHQRAILEALAYTGRIEKTVRQGLVFWGA